MPGLTEAQAAAEMNLWAVSGAPLLAGNNMATMTDATAAILTNKDVIDIDQDARALPGVKVSEDSPGLQVYAKVLAGSDRRAVVLLNRSKTDATMFVRWTDLGLTAAEAEVRDVWSGKTVGTLAEGYQVTVPARDSVMITVKGAEGGATAYEAESAANTRVGSAAVSACPECSGVVRRGFGR